MGTLGNKPVTTFQALEKQSITGNAGTTYALDHAVTNENDLEVFVNNVRQEPTTAYTISGQNIVMSEAIASTDSFYVIYQAQAFSKAVPADTSITTAMLQDDAVTTAKLDTKIQITGPSSDADGTLKVTSNTPSNYPAMVVQTSTGGNSTETHGLYVNNDANGYGVKIDAGNGNQLTLNNGGERFTQLTYQSNGVQAAAIWYDSTNNALVNQATTGNRFAVQTGGGGETLTVSSAGAVNTPYQPYAIVKFSSGDDGSYNDPVTTNKIVKPSNVMSNNGNHYSSSTGYFTCPIAGVYTVQCSGNVYNNNAGSWLRPTIYKNGGVYLYHYENTQMTWHNYHFTAPVVCAANDTLGVWMGTQSGNGGGFDVNNYSMLSFMLVA